MTEDHGLCDSDGTIEVTQGLELLLLAVAHHIVLLNGIQRLLLPLEFDDVWVRDDPLGEVPHRLLERGREQKHLAGFGQHPEKKNKNQWEERNLKLMCRSFILGYDWETLHTSRFNKEC